MTDIDLAIGTVCGIRGWNLHTDGRLRGLWGQWWRPGVNTATCLALNRTCPGVAIDCTCGFYATFNPESTSTVMGVIEGFGITVIGSAGFRTEKARILGITSGFSRIAPAQGPLVRAAERYQVPLYPTVDELLAAHPIRRDP